MRDALYPLLHEILGDHKGGRVFRCFDAWHLFLIFLFIALTALVYIMLKRKGEERRRRVLDILIGACFSLYILDFFLMPFAYEEIDIEKLPFHICTAMCVMCFLSGKISWLRNYRVHFALLAFISNFVYLVYPAGVMWHQVHPFSYRVIQTLCFHGLMTVYGFNAVVFDEEGLKWKTCRRDLIVLIGMVIWALIGNYMYNGTAGNYSRFHNWFFVVEDPFGMLDPGISPFVMPFLNIAVFFGVEMALYPLFMRLERKAAPEEMI